MQAPTSNPSRAESAILAGVAGEIDEFLARSLRFRRLPGILEEAICYAVLGGGKRLRPALVLLCCEAVGGDRSVALGSAAAIELVHCFSLVHDDLPAMDDDDMRRGRPTLHVQAGEAMAILAGDAMTTLAFELIVESPLDAEHRIELTRELAASTTAMISGQVFDTLGGFPHELSDEQRLTIIHRNKTAALLRASCRMGAICGGANQASLEQMTVYGDAIGLMFQIVDDLLDVTQSPEHIGKATGKDVEAGKLTFPGVMGAVRSKEIIGELERDALQALDGLGAAADGLRELCRDMAVRTK